MRKRGETLRLAMSRASSTVRTSAAWYALLGRRLRRRLGTQRESVGTAFPGARTPKLARVEAALFASGEPLTTRRIAEIANLSDGTEARQLVQELQSLYESDGSSFALENVAGGWQLRTRPEFAPWLSKVHVSRHESRLSQPALETLAVVAYRQPILRTDIEAIRGVSCGEMLRQLIDRGLVRIVGHHDSLGRPLLYGTTRKFLEVFGIADLGDLPLAEQLRQTQAASARTEPASSPAELPAETPSPEAASG